MRRGKGQGTIRMAGPGRRSGQGGYTMVEYLVCFFIVTFTLLTSTVGYLLFAQRTNHLTAAAAAQRLAEQRMELARAARWDLYSNPPVNEVTNVLAFPTNALLELPSSGPADVIPAMVRTTVQTVSTNPPLQFIAVECIWSIARGSQVLTFTNSVQSYRAPNS